MAKSMSIKLEFVAPLPQIAITRFTYNAVEFYGPQGPRYKEVDLYFIPSSFHGLTIGKPAKYTCCEFLMRFRVSENVMHDDY